jgi:hypothetical protein
MDRDERRGFHRSDLAFRSLQPSCRFGRLRTMNESDLTTRVDALEFANAQLAILVGALAHKVFDPTSEGPIIDKTNAVAERALDSAGIIDIEDAFSNLS